MISYAIYSDDQWQYHSSELSLSEEDLDLILEDPFQSIRQAGFHVHRSIADISYQVFGWRSYQQIILEEDLTIVTSDDVSKYSERYWDIILDQMKLMRDNIPVSNDPSNNVPVPLASFLGYYGYLSYELGRLLESYDHRQDRVSRPYLVLDFPTRLLVQAQDYFIYIELDLDPITSKFQIFPHLNSTDLISGKISHDTGYEDYISDLERIIDHIKQGDIYQANYTQQFRLQVPDDIELADLYHHVLSTNDLPHAAYLNYSAFEVMSISPELFLHISDGHVVTKPIKGTRPRGEDAEEDQQFIRELISSKKDQAELAMIVDLLRNDLGKSSLPGSVEVDAHAVVETYENVHHLVSTVSATIASDLSSSWKLLLRAFPGGSISGVPKLRSLEIIEAYEKVTRDIYTGTIGYLGLNGDIDLNIAIRTVILDHLPDKSSMATFNAGGGIVFDSNPVEEYIESLHKAKHIANYLKHSFIGDIVYIDGTFKLAEHNHLEPTDTGIFETILVEDGQPRLWEYHIQRLNRSQGYYDMSLETICLEDIHQLFRLNLATNGKIRLNIYQWKDEVSAEHRLVKVQPYFPPRSPVSLLLDEESEFDVPKAMQKGLKSLDYDPYRKATRAAIIHDCWDQLLISRTGNLLEGGRSNVYFYINECWYTPNQNIVKGTIRQYLLDQHLVEAADIALNQLSSATAIAVSNALIGIIPVKSIHNISTPDIWIMSNVSAGEDLVQKFDELVYSEP